MFADVLGCRAGQARSFIMRANSPPRSVAAAICRSSSSIIGRNFAPSSLVCTIWTTIFRVALNLSSSSTMSIRPATESRREDRFVQFGAKIAGVTVSDPGQQQSSRRHSMSGVWGSFSKQRARNPRKPSTLVFSGLPMVPRRGLEPPRPCGHWHLKPARLPIPPSGHCGVRGG